MFPIRDHNPSGRTPYVTFALIAANVGWFLLYWLGAASENQIWALFETRGLIPARIMAGEGWATFFTAIFLHGGWMHLIGNMLFLWIFGDNLEDIMGHLRFALFYLASGIAAALLQIAAEPSSLVPMVGASGAIAGVMGGYLLLFPKARVDILLIFIIFFRVFPVPAWAMLGLWFGLQLLNGLSTPSDGGGVAYWAHAGGFAAGLMLTIPFWLSRGGPAFWRRTHGAPPHPDAQYPLAKSGVPRVPRRK
ncbi:rhomboid family intramembrane serine protease [Paracoccaceae bacterium Fryx2]|nr:rhomboid family intramembrane serine protease [Paracoccaceae bacterium Fryx2]